MSQFLSISNYLETIRFIHFSLPKTTLLKTQDLPIKIVNSLAHSALEDEIKLKTLIALQQAISD